MTHHSKSHKLLAEAYSDKKFWESLNTDPIGGKRQLGSVEWLGTSTTLDKTTAEKVAQMIQMKSGYQTKLIPTPEGFTVAFYKELSEAMSKALALYGLYESMPEDKDGTTVQGLTKEQHRFLGQMFGFTKADINDFIENAGFE